MSFNDDGSKELPELKLQLRDGTERVKDEVVVQEQRLVEENGLRSGGGVAAYVTNGQSGPTGGQAGPQAQQKQPQGTMVCWERFLHLRSLKVLLVENDDSTRHVVTALLRNCSYDVIEATNGLQAWKILEDLTNHVDLVLTEVVMPCLSGVGLLCKIMSHKTRKNVPVIMMSSHDSMVLVFKCLSKGAVDFLVKPIRKNELKNLWQHVWRRCHSSSGSGSESGAQTQNSIKSKSGEEYDNNAGSNNEEENGSIGLNVGDGSDNGSGTQSSWTKQAVEVESSRQMCSREQMVECPDSTCAWIVHPNAETCDNQLVSAATRKECQEHKQQIENQVMGRDLEISTPGKLKAELDYPNEVPNKLSLMRKDNPVEMVSSKSNVLINKGRAEFDIENASSQLKHESCNVTPAITNITDLQMDNMTEFYPPNRHAKVTDVKNKHDSEELSSLELGLKRLRGSKSAGTSVQDDRNVLRRSNSSAFSRYNAASNAKKASTINAGSSFPRDSSTEVTKQESHNLRSQSSGNPPNYCSIGCSNNIITGYTTNHAVSNYVILNKSGTTSSSQQLHPSSAFHLVENNLSSVPKQVTTANPDGEPANQVLAQTNKELHAQHLHIHYDNYQVHNHIVHGVQQQHSIDHNDLSLKKLATAAPRCGSSNVLSGPVEGHTANSSINKSTSGSNHGSSTAINVTGTNIESENRVSRKCSSGDSSGSGREIENKSAHREAALIKFRQKRKERCFHKKVRYQSRKKLAEQRPRVRGQFVRQTANENTGKAADS